MRHLFHYERRRQPLAPAARFSSRLARNFIWALALIVAALALGMSGYMGFEYMGVVDAFANAAMILSGMGQLTPLATKGGKIFAACYAIFSGLFLFAVAGLILAPVIHRVLHRFHMESDDDKAGADGA